MFDFAMESPDPVIIFEYTFMLNLEKEIPAEFRSVENYKKPESSEGKDDFADYLMERGVLQMFGRLPNPWR